MPKKNITHFTYDGQLVKNKLKENDDIILKLVVEIKDIQEFRLKEEA